MYKNDQSSAPGMAGRGNPSMSWEGIAVLYLSETVGGGVRGL